MASDICNSPWPAWELDTSLQLVLRKEGLLIAVFPYSGNNHFTLDFCDVTFFILHIIFINRSLRRPRKPGSYAPVAPTSLKHKAT